MALTMRDVELEFETLNGGKVLASANNAILAAAQNIEDEPKLKGPREITIKIKITPRAGSESHVDTEAKVETKFPVQSTTGLGWIVGGVPITQREIADKTGQIDWTLAQAEARDPDNRRREQHAMGLRRAEAEDRREAEIEASASVLENAARRLRSAGVEGLSVSVQAGGRTYPLTTEPTAQAEAIDDGAEPDTFDPSEEDGGVLGATIAATEGRRKPKPQGAGRRKGE